MFSLQVVKKFGDVVWHVSWSVTGSILAVSGGDNKVCKNQCFLAIRKAWDRSDYT